MELNILVIIKYFVFLLVSLSAYYIIGHFFHACAKVQPKKENTWELVFLNMLIGFFIITSLFAIYLTKGKTITILVFLVICIYFVILRQKNRIYNYKFLLIINYRHILIIMALSAFVYVLHLQWFIDFKTNNRFTLANDMLYWARLSEHTLFNKIENGSFDYFNLNSNSRTPYHWIEIWNSSLNMFLFNQNSSFSLILNTFASLCVILLTGAITISKKVGNKKLAFIISPLILFTTHYYIRQYSATPSFTVLNSPKMLTVVTLFLATIIWYNKKEYLIASLFIILIGLSYIVVLPSMFSAAIIALLILKLTNKTSFKTAGISIGMIVLATVLIAFFYITLSSNNASSYNNIGTIKNILIYVEGNGFKDILLKSFITSFKFLGNWIFIITLFIALYYKKELKVNFVNAVVIIVFLVTPAISWSLMQWHHESHQLHTIQFHSIMIIINFIIIAFVISIKNRVFKILAILMIGYVLIVQPERVLYSMKLPINQSEYNKTHSFISKYTFPNKFAQIKRGDDRTSQFFEANTNLTLYDIEFISQIIKSPFIVPTLSVNDIVIPEDPFLATSFKGTIGRSILNRYLESENLKDNIISRQRFIKEYNIDFLVFGDTLLLEPYKEIITDTIVLKSGKVLGKTIY